MGSRIGIHIIGKGAQIPWLERVKPAVVVTLFNGIDAGWVHEAKAASKDTLWVGRLVADQNLDRHEQFVDDLLRVAEPYHADVTALIGYNEVSCQNEVDMARWADLEEYRSDRLHVHGWQSVVGNFATGNPQRPDLDMFIWPAFYRAIIAGDYLGLHEYGWPDMRYDQGWHCGRFQWVYEMALQAPELRRPLIISECGIDKGSRPPWNGECGWRASGASAAEYVAQLRWYDSLLIREMQRLGIDIRAAVYCSGDNGDDQWRSFALDYAPQGERSALDLLGDYIAASRRPKVLTIWREIWERITRR